MEGKTMSGTVTTTSANPELKPARTISPLAETLVSSSMIDRVVKKLTRRLSEVPVGFKWFAEGLCDSSYCFGGEESAVASFLRFDRDDGRPSHVIRLDQTVNRTYHYWHVFVRACRRGSCMGTGFTSRPSVCGLPGEPW